MTLPEENQNKLFPAKSATMELPTITQPRTETVITSPERPAVPAAFNNVYSPSHHEALNSQNIPITGPPPVQPFGQQTFRNPQSPAGAERGESVSSTPFGQPAPPQPQTDPSTSPYGPVYTSEMLDNSGNFWRSLASEQNSGSRTPSNSTSTGDHDYSSRPAHLTDHAYYRPAEEQSPPPGFPAEGRPTRNRKLPSKLTDYVLQ